MSVALRVYAGYTRAMHDGAMEWKGIKFSHLSRVQKKKQKKISPLSGMLFLFNSPRACITISQH
jgi:hypothetical protein